MDSIFDLSKISFVATISNVPVDISSGLVIDADFLKVVRETKEEVKSRKGTKNESYSINSIEDDSRLIDLVYLPTSPAVPILQAARISKVPFKLSITSTTAPAYSLIASNCTITEEPEIIVNGKEGFKDITFKIRALDCIVSYK